MPPRCVYILIEFNVYTSSNSYLNRLVVSVPLLGPRRAAPKVGENSTDVYVLIEDASTAVSNSSKSRRLEGMNEARRNTISPYS